MSSGISFNMLICVIPFTLILLTILGYYLDSETVQQRLISYLNSMVPLPGQYKDRFIFELTDRTKELSSNAFITGAIGLGGLFWTVSGLFSTMREVLRRIYRIDTELNYFIGKLRDFALVILSVILFILSMAITSSIQIFEEYSQGLFGELITLTLFEKIIPMLIGFIISFCLFYVLYALVPHGKINRRVVLFSSFISAIFFEALKYLFSVYILKIANYGKIYGTYATIVISIFYIYYLSVIFVVGAELGEIYYQKNKENLDSKIRIKTTKL
jgi:membrane protein